RQERFAQEIEDPGLIAAKVVGEDQVQRCSCLWFVLIVPIRVVPSATLRHLLRGKTEKEEIFLSRLLRHFNCCAIPSADRQRPVHHELHVAGATRLVARGRNLIGDVAGGNQPFSERYVVLRNEQDLEATAHPWIAVDCAGQVVDELYDELGKP